MAECYSFIGNERIQKSKEFICLNECHPCLFDTMETSDSQCRFVKNMYLDYSCNKSYDLIGQYWDSYFT